MKKDKEWKYVYYSAETDELFRLYIKVKDPKRVFKLYVEDHMLMSYVIYLGEL